MKDQEGMIPPERRLTKQITEYTQRGSDETPGDKRLWTQRSPHGLQRRKAATRKCRQAQLLSGPSAALGTKPLLSAKPTAAGQGREQKVFNWGGERAAL